MGLFGKKKEVRNLTKEEEADIKEEMARQMFQKTKMILAWLRKSKT